ncbi:MarR family winged helix-turn-helix transcriptional regulator [Aliikangiella sp. IMCC44359]|uniref:MarR family winged helix-turn-helix transcriptional regulator n=1 Tax=Aliikangiella sp. IMCC44359 TaxID=3459125 RepID=UPI00403ACF3D
MKRTFGTQLRHLIEMMDGSLNQVYEKLGYEYRSRYTPVIKALIQHEELSISEIAAYGGITQPAATQTVNIMAREGIILAFQSKIDARQKQIKLSEKGKALYQSIQTIWKAVDEATTELEKTIGYPLSEIAEKAIIALEERPFYESIVEKLKQ